MRRRSDHLASNGETYLKEHAVASFSAKKKQLRHKSAELHVGHASCICAALALMVGNALSGPTPVRG